MEQASRFFGVVFLSSKCGRLGVMFPQRLVVYEATYAKNKPQVKKGTVSRARSCRCKRLYRHTYNLQRQSEVQQSALDVDQSVMESVTVTSHNEWIKENRERPWNKFGCRSRQRNSRSTTSVVWGSPVSHVCGPRCNGTRNSHTNLRWIEEGISSHKQWNKLDTKK